MPGRVSRFPALTHGHRRSHGNRLWMAGFRRRRCASKRKMRRAVWPMSHTALMKVAAGSAHRRGPYRKTVAIRYGCYRCGNVQTAVIDVSHIDAQAPQLPEGAEIHLRPTNAAPSSAIVHHLLFGSYFSSMTVCVPYVDEGSGVAQIELFDAQGQLLGTGTGTGPSGRGTAGRIGR